jgi:hypothetical protein
MAAFYSRQRFAMLPFAMLPFGILIVRAVPVASEH